MKRSIYSFVISTIMLTSVAQGEQNFDVDSMVGYSWGSVEGSPVGLSRLSASTHWKYSDLFAIGPSLRVNYGNSKTDLFDEYMSTELGLDLVSGTKVQQFFPYWRFNVTLASKVQAEGEITRRITNGTDQDNGMIKFPASGGASIGTSDGRVDEFGYELKGKTQGAELSIGSKWNVSDRLAFAAEAGYAAKTLIIDQAKGSNFGMSGGAEYSYEQRRGVIASGKNASEGYNVEIERKSRYFGSSTLSLALNYKI